MKYIYGPLHSRRLGLSLGITLTPKKVCPYDCIYCQIGVNSLKAIERREYIDINQILLELEGYFKAAGGENARLDYITLSGFGEPTLNIKMGELAARIKKLVPAIPLALITNGALFKDASVRREVGAVDLIVPSLDAVTQDVFIDIDRPLDSIRIEDVINGLILLRQEYKGMIYLEIMIIKDKNDSLEYALEFKKAIDKIHPDKVQLNSPVRTTSPEAKAAHIKRLLEIKEILGDRCEVI